DRARAVDDAFVHGLGIGITVAPERQDGEAHRLLDIAPDDEDAPRALVYFHDNVAMGRRETTHIAPTIGEHAAVGARAGIAQQGAGFDPRLARLIGDIGRLLVHAVACVDRLIDIVAMGDRAMELSRV